MRAWCGKISGLPAKYYKISVLETSQGYYENTYRSVRITTDTDLSQFVGSVQWVCPSPYRIGHKRKNWFLDFSSCAEAETEVFDPKQVLFETFRSSGKGGQNVNKVETGVRVIYLPTGQASVCTEERSQYLNKQKQWRASGKWYKVKISKNKLLPEMRTGAGIPVWNVEMHGQSLKDGILSEWHNSKPLLVVFTLAEYNGRNNKPLYKGKVISNVTIVCNRRSTEIHCFAS